MRTLYLNLDSRPDRRAEAEAEFQRVGLTVERVAAIGGENPMLAFNQSVYKAMELARGEDLLLFEDDVVFDGNFYNNLEGFGTALLELPENAMTMHLGCNFMGSWEMPKHYNWRLAILPNCFQSHATYYSTECVQFILDNMRTDIMDEDNNIFDDWLRRKVLNQGRSYVMKPMVAYQRPSITNIWGGIWSDYTSCHRDGNKYLSKL